MIIYGWKRYAQVLAVLTLVCQQCAIPAEHVLRRLTTKSTLFFIPLFPISRRHTLTCSSCQSEQKLTREQATHLATSAPQPTPPQQPQHPAPQPQHAGPQPQYAGPQPQHPGPPPQPAYAQPPYQPGPPRPQPTPGPYAAPPPGPYGAPPPYAGQPSLPPLQRPYPGPPQHPAGYPQHPYPPAR